MDKVLKPERFDASPNSGHADLKGEGRMYEALLAVSS